MTPGADAQAFTYDPWDPDVLEDPYPYFAALREKAPVYHVEEHDIWVVSRYDDLVSAARNVEVFSSNQGNSYERRPVPMLVGLDPPEHTRVRRLVARHWTPRVINQLAPRIERLCEEILDRAFAGAEAGGTAEVDFLVDIAEPLPVTLIAEIMGIPTEDWPRFRRWSDATVDQMAGPPTEENELLIAEFAMYFLDLVARRQAEFDEGTVDIDDPNDMVGILFGRTPDGDRLAPEEIIAMCVLLVVAGNETTTNLMANMAVVLADRQDVWDAVAADGSLMAPMVEESIRYLSPVQGLFRNTLSEAELGGAAIPADAKVFLCYASANRDTAKWPDADEFRLDRYPQAPNDADHVAFAPGIHLCLGAHLARLEASIMYRQLIERVASSQVTGPVVRGRNPSIRGIKSLPMTMTLR
ncbi:MAG: cytochrome P450 [Microthrixaceae bacterium]